MEPKPIVEMEADIDISSNNNLLFVPLNNIIINLILNRVTAFLKNY